MRTKPVCLAPVTVMSHAMPHPLHPPETAAKSIIITAISDSEWEIMSERSRFMTWMWRERISVSVTSSSVSCGASTSLLEHLNDDFRKCLHKTLPFCARVQGFPSVRLSTRFLTLASPSSLSSGGELRSHNFRVLTLTVSELFCFRSQRENLQYSKFALMAR